MMRAAAFVLVIAGISAASLAAGQGRPGWLGFGFEYHPPDGKNHGWMWIRRVAAASPAAAAGLRPQDVIVAMDRKELRFGSDLAVLESLARVAPRQRLVLSVVRGHQRLSMPIVAASMTDDQFRTWQRNFEMARRAAPPK